MPIIARESQSPILNLFVFSGPISAPDLDAILLFHAARAGAAAGRDEVLLFDADADLSALRPDDLARFKSALGAVLRKVKPAMVVRTALVNRAPACRPVLEAWAGMSSPDDGFHTEVRVMATIAEAAQWIGLSVSDVARIEQQLTDAVAT